MTQGTTTSDWSPGRQLPHQADGLQPRRRAVRPADPRRDGRPGRRGRDVHPRQGRPAQRRSEPHPLPAAGDRQQRRVLDGRRGAARQRARRQGQGLRHAGRPGRLHHQRLPRRHPVPRHHRLPAERHPVARDLRRRRRPRRPLRAGHGQAVRLGVPAQPVDDLPLEVQLGRVHQPADERERRQRPGALRLRHAGAATGPTRRTRTTPTSAPRSAAAATSRRRSRAPSTATSGSAASRVRRRSAARCCPSSRPGFTRVRWRHACRHPARRRPDHLRRGAAAVGRARLPGLSRLRRGRRGQPGTLGRRRRDVRGAGRVAGCRQAGAWRAPRSPHRGDPRRGAGCGDRRRRSAAAPTATSCSIAPPIRAAPGALPPSSTPCPARPARACTAWPPTPPASWPSPGSICARRARGSTPRSRATTV